MGQMSDAFKRQIGKDAGRAVSNLIFGDKHAAPKRVSISEKKELLKLEAQKQQHKHEMKKIKAEQKIQNKELLKESISNIKTKYEEKKANEVEQLFHLETNVNEQIEILSTTPIPDDKVEITKLLDELLLKLKAGKWESGQEKDELSNKLLDAQLAKGIFAINKLKHQHPDAFEVSMYEKEFKKIKFRKIQQLYGVFIIVALILGTVGILYALGIIKD